MSNQDAMAYLGRKVRIGSFSGIFEFGWDGLEDVFQLLENEEPVCGGPLANLEREMIYEYEENLGG